jgi:hypothetical protein
MYYITDIKLYFSTLMLDILLCYVHIPYYFEFKMPS